MKYEANQIFFKTMFRSAEDSENENISKINKFNWNNYLNNYE